MSSKHTPQAVTHPHTQTSTQADSVKIAKATQKPGQTKEQTKLIAQGIEKGIAEYKKQQKKKARDLDKQRKKELKQKSSLKTQPVNSAPAQKSNRNHYKTALFLSWLFFITYLGYLGSLT